MTKLKMNPFRRGVVAGIVIMSVMDVIVVIYYSRKFHEGNTKRTATTTNFRPDREFNFYHVTQKSACQVDVVSNLTGSGLKRIQKERKSRIKDVCDMCRMNRTSMECNHVTLDEDYHNNNMYDSILVDDIHEVSDSLSI